MEEMDNINQFSGLLERLLEQAGFQGSGTITSYTSSTTDAHPLVLSSCNCTATPQSEHHHAAATGSIKIIKIKSIIKNIFEIQVSGYSGISKGYTPLAKAHTRLNG